MCQFFLWKYFFIIFRKPAGFIMYQLRLAEKRAPPFEQNDENRK